MGEGIDWKNGIVQPLSDQYTIWMFSGKGNRINLQTLTNQGNRLLQRQEPDEKRLK
jgi:hypothetical protein